MKVDPNGPCPMEYHAAEEWRAIRAGKPPMTPGAPYNIPTEYHAREALFRHYKNAQRRFLTGRSGEH